eukprot:INCI14781.5.p1 GENE.INCI14781.5~~INCI14781.5.p1  ORF type:complete len:2228 (+),score=293.23 INCI14781.5:208-6891(+)
MGSASALLVIVFFGAVTVAKAGETCPIVNRPSLNEDDEVGWDFEYFVSQVGIDTTLKNALGAQLYQEKLCKEFKSYTHPALSGSKSISCFEEGSLQGMTSGNNSDIRQRATVGDDWCSEAADTGGAGTTHNPYFDEYAVGDATSSSPDPLGMFCGAKANWDYNSDSYRERRELTVSNTQVLIGDRDPRDPNSIGQFIFTGSLSAFMPGYFYGGYYIFWFWNRCCSGSPADLTLTIPKFTVTVGIGKNPTNGSFEFTTSCDAPVDPNTGIIFDGCNDCNYFFQHGFFQNFIKTCVVPGVNSYICPQLESYLLADMKEWLLPDQIFRLGSSPISVEYTTNCLEFVGQDSVMMQAAMAFLVDDPAGGPPTRFDKHRTSSMLPWHSWPVDTAHNATTSAVAISRQTIENFLDAANFAGYLKFNGTFVVYGTKLFVNGSIDNVSVAFPTNGVNADVTVNERDMLLHIHCDNYTGFKIFDVTLVKVSEAGVVACQSWTSGISMQLTDTKIGNASMEGVSTSLEIPTVLLKPLVLQGVTYALPVINEALSHLTFQFPNDVSWLAPLAPDPVTRTIGPSAGEEGHVEIIWTCQCGENVNISKRCGGTFCPPSTASDDTRGIPTAPPSASCAPTDPLQLEIYQSKAFSPTSQSLAFVLYPTTSCAPLKPGDNVTVGNFLLEPADSICFNTSSEDGGTIISNPMVALLGEYAQLGNIESQSATLSTDCARTPFVPPLPSQCTSCGKPEDMEFGHCYGGLVMVPANQDGSIDCESVNLTAQFDPTMVALQLQLVPVLGVDQAQWIGVSARNDSLAKHPLNPLFSALVGNASSLAMATSSVFLLPTDGAISDRCVKCAPKGMPFQEASDQVYCQVREVAGQMLTLDLFCASSNCDPSTCAKSSFVLQLQWSYQLQLSTASGSMLRFKALNSSSVAMCGTNPGGNWLGLPSWVWFTVGTVMLVAGSAVLAVYLRRKASRVDSPDQQKTSSDAPVPLILGAGALFYCIFFVLVAAPVIWTWTYANPASLQSENVTKTMAYAASNQSNSSFSVNFDEVAPQMQSYIDSGRNVLLFLFCSLCVVVVGASFNCNRSWSFRRCGIVRATALCIALLTPLLGFGMFVVDWNWLNVVHMGGSDSGNASATSASTVAAVLSAAWLESVVVSTLSAFANGLMVVTPIAVGTMMALDDVKVVGGSLSGADWTSWVSSLVMLQIVCTLASLLVKLVLLVTRFETNASEMFITLAALASAPMLGLTLQGINRCARTTHACGQIKVLSWLRTLFFRLIGLGLVAGGPYAVVFRFGEAKLNILSLKPELWNIACVFMGALVAAVATVELLLMSNSSYKETAKFQMLDRYKPARVLAAATTTNQSDAREALLRDVAAGDADLEESTPTLLLDDVPQPSRPVHYISLVWKLPEAKLKRKKVNCTALAYVARFFLEVTQWLAEVGPYKPFEKILYRRGSAIIAAFPLYFMARASYSGACAQYGYDDLFRMTRDELFNCSYAELTAELSDYANTTVNLDRTPGSAFYDIIELRANSTIDGAQISMLGISVFFAMAILSAIEGLEIPLLRFRSSRCLAAVTGRTRPQLPKSHRVRILLQRVSRCILAVSQILGVASIAVLCVATFQPYTLPYADLLHIACLCEAGKFCSMIKSSITATFQNLQLASLGKEIFVLAVSIPWTLGRIAAFVHMDVSAETAELRHRAERKLENKLQHAREVALKSGQTLEACDLAFRKRIITAEARRRAEKVEDSHARNSVVWVAFACTALFMLFVGTIMGVAAAVMGMPNPVWVIALTALGGITPLLVVLFDAASCSRASHGTQFYTVGATFAALVGVPVATFTCFQLSGNPGPWDYLAVLGMSFYGLSLLLSVMMPVVGTICCPQTQVAKHKNGEQKRRRRRPTACGKIPWRQELFPEEMASEFHRVTHFTAAIAIFGASAYCIAMALWHWSPFLTACLLCLLAFVIFILFAFIFVPNFRLPDTIRYTAELAAKHPAKCKKGSQLCRVYAGNCSQCLSNGRPDSPASFKCSDCESPCTFCETCAIAAWTRTQLSSRTSYISHTENIDVQIVPEAALSAPHTHSSGHNSDDSDDGDEQFQLHNLTHDPKAVVIVNKRGSGRRTFKLVMFAQGLRKGFSEKTVLMYLAWGDAWFLFSLLYILSKVLLFGAPSIATDLGINATQPCFSLLKGTFQSLFTADGWPFTLAEFFGADVVLTDIIFGAMALSRLCRGDKRYSPLCFS